QTHLLGGEFPIDASRARAAVAALGRGLEMRAEEAAAGIVALIDDAMAKALRIVTIERGIDPRDFTLVAFGGGGPLHACALADELEIRRILVPAHPGLFSAFGLLDAELHVNDVWPVMSAADALDVRSVERAFTAKGSRARTELCRQGARDETIAFRRECDARYRGQSFELTIAYDSNPARIAERFHESHRARYGYDAPDEVVEVVNARLTASGKVAAVGARATLRVTLSLSSGAESRDKGRHEATRAVWIDNNFTDVPVFQRNALRSETTIAGPAIVEQYDTTTYVAPRWKLGVEDDLLVLARDGR
ncbi:MAG: hypothetical protein JO263_05075, partial [Candidatus Eremiobacteraeota bacterium]|nr:hypothetical protein [Candidatus Eremiobacteraeota bacterium]